MLLKKNKFCSLANNLTAANDEEHQNQNTDDKSMEEEQALDNYLNLYFQKYSALMAQIPWVINSPRKDYMLLQNAFYRDMIQLKRGDLILNKRKRILRLFVDNVFPFYLPKRYHSMHCMELSRSSSRGEYWLNATSFLVKSHFNGLDCHKLILEEMATQKPNLIHSPIIGDYSIEGHNDTSWFDQCQTASEFLLEPWVLLQLPFQPSLLHQWAVALLAVTLKFQKDTVTIFVIGVPKELHEEVQMLKTMVEILLEGAITLLSVFGNFAKGAGQQNICKKLRQSRTKLLDTITKVTPVVEFILSDRCKNVTSGIKRASWGSTNNADDQQQNLYPVDIDADLGLFPIWYNSMFWTNDEMPKELVNKQKYPDDHHSKFLQHLSSTLKLYSSEESLAYLKNFVEEKIINNKKLVGASSQDILAVVDRVPRELPFPWSEYFKYPREISASDECISGVTYNISSLYYEFKTEKETAETARTLIKLLGTAQFGCKKVVYKDEQSQQGYKLTAATNLKHTFDKVLANREWTYEKVLEKTSATFTAPIVHMEAPTSMFRVEKVAGIFQARVKNLVLNMLKRQFETSADGSHSMLWYPECSTVQYLLPCFIATFLDLHKSATRNQLKICLILVHELLLSYEQHPYEQSFNEQWKQPYLHERRHTLAHEIIISFAAFVQCIKDKFVGTKILTYLVAGFNSLLATIPAVAKSDQENELFDSWRVQLFMLTNRLQMCMMTLGWYKEPLIDYFDKVWRGCSFAMDYRNNAISEACRTILQDLSGDKVKGISDYEILAIAIFQALKNSKDLANKADLNLQGPIFPLDLHGNVFWAAETGDYWKLKQLMAPLLCNAGPVLVSELLEAHFDHLLKEPYVSEQPLTGAKFVKMSQPGEDTMYPVKHCRWCGLLAADEVFRVCPLCLETPEYYDTNHFCSEECEKEALDKQHREEHARYYMVKLNIDSR